MMCLTIILIFFFAATCSVRSCDQVGDCPKDLNCITEEPIINLQCKTNKVLRFFIKNDLIDTFTFIWDAPSLLELIIEGKNIKHFENLEIASKIYLLSIKAHQLNKISPKTFGQLGNVRKFNLKTDYVGEIESGAFLGWNRIQVVNISKNLISTISENAFKRNSTLQQLYCSNNSIEDVKFLEKLTNLEYLNLSSNKIRNISQLTFGLMKKLKFLLLMSNTISNLNFLDNSMNLLVADLRYNAIEDLPVTTLHKSEKLETLLLSHNYIKVIKSGTFLNLQLLKTLDLSHNKISIIGEVFPDLKCNTINLAHNMLKTVSLPNEKSVEVNIADNLWSCAYIKELLTYKSIQLKYVESRNVSNYKGVACNDFQTSFIDARIETQETIAGDKMNKNSFLLIMLVTSALILFLIATFAIGYFGYNKLKASSVRRRLTTMIPLVNNENGYLTPKTSSICHTYEEIKYSTLSNMQTNDYYVHSF